MTELSPVLCINPDDSNDAKAASVGVLVPNAEARVVHTTTGEPLGPKEDGEVWVRGPMVMAQYPAMPQRTPMSTMHAYTCVCTACSYISISQVPL